LGTKGQHATSRPPKPLRLVFNHRRLWTIYPVPSSVSNYKSTLRNIPEERRSHLYGGRSL